MEILKLVAEGHTSKEIGELPIISAKTVERHRAHLLHPPGQDRASGYTELRCAEDEDDDEDAAGIACTGRVGSARTPDAPYCRKPG